MGKPLRGGHCCTELCEPHQQPAKPSQFSSVKQHISKAGWSHQGHQGTRQVHRGLSSRERHDCCRSQEARPARTASCLPWAAGITQESSHETQATPQNHPAGCSQCKAGHGGRERAGRERGAGGKSPSPTPEAGQSTSGSPLENIFSNFWMRFCSKETFYLYPNWESIM